MSDQEREEMSIIALTDEQGNEVEFELLDVVPYNGQEYTLEQLKALNQ